MFKFLKLESSDGIGTITLNRPEVYNAFNDGLSYELQDALKSVTVDDKVRVVVITGEGKAFCAGQDLKEASGMKNKSFSESVLKRYNPIILAMRSMPKPITCRLNGIAAGAECSLALACDLIIAAEEAILVEAFINIGLVMDSGSSYFLPRLVGSAKAFELSTMGTKVNAKEALDMGLVNKVVPLATLDQAVKTYTGYYANAPTKAIGVMKKMLNKSFHTDLKGMLEYEAYCQEIAGRTNDHQEGIKAFMEKRKAVFKGR